MILFNAARVESRRNFRIHIKEKLPIHWRIDDKGLGGIGAIRNLSDSGMMVETNGDNRLLKADNCLLAIEPSLDFIPSAGRLVWLRKKNFGRQGFLCGVEFVNPAQEIIGKLHEKIQVQMKKVIAAEKLKNAAGTIFFGTMIILTAVAIRCQMEIYESYKETTLSLFNTSAKQSSLYVHVSQGLAETKAALLQTQAMLVEAQQQNRFLQDGLGVANSKNAELESSIALLREQNENFQKEISDLKERLRPFEGKFGSLQESRSSLMLVRKRLHDIKININELNQKARLTMIAAQKQKDAILLAQGNRGYITRDSQFFAPLPPKPDKKIKIDVSVFE